MIKSLQKAYNTWQGYFEVLAAVFDCHMLMMR